MNFRDSEFVKGLLFEHGFSETRALGRADVILFNTCSVRKHAEDRAFSNLWDARPLKDKKPHIVIGVIGCMAQAKKEALLEKAPFVDFVCGPDDEQDIPRIIRDILREKIGGVIAVRKVGQPWREVLPRHRDDRIKAFVSISRGCNNFCSYCIVPFVRGRERSRDSEAILKEVRDLARRGFKEVTLLGQNVNSYKGHSLTGRKGNDFIRLLEDINKIKGIERIRFMTSHPKDASPDLFKAMRDLEHVCEHLHLPVQSGSDRILALMNRGYRARSYLRLAEEYWRIVPDGSITTDIIVGFPTETDTDFRRTKDLMRSIGFDSAFIFKYSPRPPARAVSLPDDVPAEAKKSRNVQLLDMQMKTSEKKNRALIGTRQEILVEGSSQDREAASGAALTGRTRQNKIVIYKARPGDRGKLVTVTIKNSTCHTLFGSLR